MIAAWIWLITIVAGLFAVLVISLQRKRRLGEPEIVKGHLIWGNAQELRMDAVKFIQRCQKEYGQIFTIRLLNRHVTVIADPHSYEAMSKEKNFDFSPITNEVNKNVYCFKLAEAKELIKDTGKMTRGDNLHRSMQSFTSNLEMTCRQVCPENNKSNEWTTMGLRSFCSKTIFDAIFHTIFGRSLSGPFTPQKVFKNLEIYQKYFRFLWLGVPKFIFPQAVTAFQGLLCQPDPEELLNRDDCSGYIKQAVTCMKLQGQPEGDIMGHNICYLHVNTNTFRLAFWVLNNLLEDEEAFAALEEELNKALEERMNKQTNIATFSMKDLEDLPILDSFCQETIRLSGGIFYIRYVNKDTPFITGDGKTHLVRKGDRVLLYPPAIHKDPDIYQNPDEFQYDRFVDAKFYKDGKELKQPVIGFGSQCPGKRYAILQLKWYIIYILNMFEMRLHDGEHAQYDAHCHGHEVLSPKNDLQFMYRMKSEINCLKLE